MWGKFVVIFRILLGFLTTLVVGVYGYRFLRQFMLQVISVEQAAAIMGIIGFILVIPIVFCLGYFLYRRKVRSLTPEQYESLLGRNLIHYSNNPSTSSKQASEHDGVVRLYSSRKDAPNSHLSLVWFHLSDFAKPQEPVFRSYWCNHYSESKPYTKTIIPLSEIPFNRIFIRPQDHSIAVIGDVEAKGHIQEDFAWYNDRIYLLPTLRYSIVSFLILVIIWPILWITHLLNCIGKRKNHVS